MNMKIIVAIVLMAFSIPSFADKTLQCERYTVQENKKKDWTVFTLTLSQTKSAVLYKKVSGPDWFLPSDSEMTIIWKAKDNLRAVVQWIASKYGEDKSRWSPVYIMDIDFQKPNYKMENYGGFADFSELIYSPWKQECSRLD
ncbi:MAG: hypothetical protein Q7T48_12700 [Cellvibrio sp.]|uniref:hypothetical protein n=1 Tax=Cellvibrio sp. TaxID=1965322 RepID=UPI002720758C|nr:hypothetical protein [Cellvibrio sp.]